MATLLLRLSTFSAALRRAGFCCGPAEVQVAVQAAEVVGWLNVKEVQSAWCAVFARNAQQASEFGPLFRAYFLRSQDTPLSPDAPPELQAEPGAKPSGEADAPSLQDTQPGAAPTAPGAAAEEEQQASLLRTRLSPHAAEGAPPRVAPNEEALLRQAAVGLLRVRLGCSRRRVVGGRQQVELRATLRAARRTGGEAFTLHYRQRARSGVRVLLLLDGSRSMAPYAALLLRYAAALRQQGRKRVEVYSFSTSLRRLTPQLENRWDAGPQAGTLLLVPSAAWGGGTRIAANLVALRRQARAFLGPRTLLLVLSDGLETGEPHDLSAALRALRPQVGAVVWLNPLAAQVGYQPLARGMAAALPYLDVFAGIEDAADLLTLPSLL